MGFGTQYYSTNVGYLIKFGRGRNGKIVRTTAVRRIVSI